MRPAPFLPFPAFRDAALAGSCAAALLAPASALSEESVAARGSFSYERRDAAPVTVARYERMEYGTFFAFRHFPGQDVVSYGSYAYRVTDGRKYVDGWSASPVPPSYDIAADLARVPGISPFVRQQVDLLDAVHGVLPVSGHAVPAFLGARYAGASQDAKIGMARVMSDYMGAVGYDHEMARRYDPRDVRSRDMWAAYAQGGVAGVCRHIHGETARFLRAAGMEAGVVTTDTRGGGHEIVWGKKADGTFFLVDYGDLYESRDPRELKARYLSLSNGMALSEYVGDPDGDVVGTLRSRAEEVLFGAVSSDSGADVRDTSASAAREGLAVPRGWSLGVDGSADGSRDGGGSAYVGHGGGRFFGGFSGLGSRIDDVRLSVASGALGAGGRIGDCQARVSGKASHVEAVWDSGVRRRWYALAADAALAGCFVHEGPWGVGGAVTGSASVFAQDAAKEAQDAGLCGSQAAAAVDGSYASASGPRAGVSASCGADLLPSSVRYDAGLRAAPKAALEARAGWSWDGWSVGGKGGVARDVNSAKASAGISAGAGPVSAAVERVRDVKMENPFLLPESSRNASVSWAVHKTLSLSVGYGDRSDGESMTRRGSVSAEAGF